MNKILITAGLLLGVTGIVLGAFAAHGLKSLIDEASIKSFETGVRYQMYHAFLLIILGATSFVSKKIKTIVFYLVLLGVLCFSFSIYGLATNDLSSINFKSIAFVTPIGGLLLISAWLFILVHVLKSKVN